MRKVVKDRNFIQIQGWMLDLGISGNELIVYALIYGFSQEQEGQFYQASLSYIMEWLQVGSKHTAINVIKKLVEKGLIKKESKVLNNVTFNKYSAIKPQFAGSAENALPVQNNDGGSAESAPNNNIYNINSNSPDINISPIPIEPPLLFPAETIDPPKRGKRKSLEFDLSFIDPILSNIMIEWMTYRKEIKKPFRSLNAIKKSYKDLIKHSNSDPVIAQKVVDQAIANGYQGLFPLKQGGRGSGVTMSRSMQDTMQRMEEARKYSEMLKQFSDE